MKIKGVIWHHSGGTQADPLASTKHHTAEIIDISHKQRWPGFTSNVHRNNKGDFFHVGYNKVIETTKKRVKATREIGEETAAARGYNTGYIHICVTGNYDQGADTWDASIEPLIYRVWKDIKLEHPHLKISDNWPHRRVANKSCFGSSLSDDHIQNVIARQAILERDQGVDEALADKRETLMKQVVFLMGQLVALLKKMNDKKED